MSLTVRGVVAPAVITINVASGSQTQASAGYPLLGGPTPVQKTGVGTLVLNQPNTVTGTTTVQQGAVQLAHPSALAASIVLPLASGTLTLTPGLQTNVFGLSPLAGGLVDVGTGLITVLEGMSQGSLVAALLAGRGDGSWTGTTGISSSSVATEIAAAVPRTLGWLDRGDGSLTFGYSAPGDTNLDWSVDILDAANFLAGGKFDSGLAATWVEGDFGYDALVDILDAADFLATGLFDAGGYNHVSGAIAAVPEPNMAGWVSVVASIAGLLVWGRRRSG
jgi:autotransporter-associated beta strand protein